MPSITNAKKIRLRWIYLDSFRLVYVRRKILGSMFHAGALLIGHVPEFQSVHQGIDIWLVGMLHLRAQ